MTSGRVRSRFTTNIARPVLDEAELRENLAAAQSWLLLNCAVHATGDTSLLDKFADSIASPSAAVSLLTVQTDECSERTDQEERRELIDLLVESYKIPNDAPLLGVGTEDVMQRMSSIAAGFPVPADQLEMNLNQGGFIPDRIRETNLPPQNLDIAIIGAGMSGIDAAVKALDRGFAVTVYDLEDGPGGVWWSQRYPGVAVDTPATFYSLSYDVRAEWGNYYPDGADYQQYLASIIEKYEFTDRMRYSSRVRSLTWLDDEQRWQIEIESTIDGAIRYESAGIVISAAGLLNRAKWPALKGLHDFQGESIHTAEWKDVDLSGKRVAVVGNGAAGVQVISSLAPVVSALTVFQRQPTYVTPNGAGDGVVDEKERWLRTNVPYYLQWTRLSLLAQTNAASIEVGLLKV